MIGRRAVLGMGAGVAVAGVQPAQAKAQRPVALGHLSVDDLTLIQAAPLAAAAGYSAMTVRMWGADLEGTVLGERPEVLRQAMAVFRDVGLGVFDANTVAIDPAFDLARYEAGLDLAAEIGIERVLAVGRDPDFNRGAESFGRLAEAAGSRGLAADVEFMMRSEVKTLADGERFVSACGLPNVGLALDATHFTRSGGVPGDIAKVDPKHLAWMHMADGSPVQPDLGFESRRQRLAPGEGVFPLAAILRALPADCLISVEIPSQARVQAGVSAADWMKQLMAATRQVIAQAETAPA